MIKLLSSKMFLLRSSTVILRLAQIGMLVVFLALGLNVSLNASEGPDEATHYYFNYFVAKYGRLPLTRVERLEAGYKADLPPLFYLITGTIGRGVDLESPPHIKITRDNPRLQLVAGHENIKAWRMIWTEDPYRGEILLWYLGRWVSLGFGLVGLGLTYYLVRVAQPGEPWLALTAVAVLAFLPTYHYISGVTSYESLTGAFMVLYFLLLFYTVRYPTQDWLYFGLGLAIGLAGAARQTPWILLPALPLYIIWLARRYHWTWGAAGWRLLLYGLGVGLTFGAWVLYIGIYFNEVADLGWFQGLLSPVLIGDGSGKTSLQIAGLVTGGELGVNDISQPDDSVWQWAWRFFSGVWGHGWLGWLLLGVWGLAGAGLIRRWRREHGAMRLWTVLLVAHIGLLLFFPLLRFLFSGQASTAMSQHILFPAGAVMILLLVYGLGAWLTPGRISGILLVLAAIYLGQDVRTALNRHLDRFPIQTLPVAANEQVLAAFDAVSLIDFDFVADEQVLSTTLVWRTEDSPSEDYRLELTLQDEANQPQARWVGQPLDGRYPTRAWLPGDRVRAVIHLPIAGLPAGEYQLQLRVLGEFGVIPSSAGDVLGLGQVMLTPPPLTPTGTVLLGEQVMGYTLWQQNRPATEILHYGENATVVLSILDRYGDEVQLKLVGPDERLHEPIDHTGYGYNFNIAPNFAGGDYRLRFEQWAGDNLVAQAETPHLLKVETESRQFEVGLLPHPVSADFAGYVALRGYDLPQRRVQAGDMLPVTLYWQAQRTIGANLILFNHLIDESQNYWGGRDRIAREAYSTMFWAPGEIVTDPFTIQIAPNVPDGIYYMLVGLYLPVGEASVSLPLVQDGQFSDVTSFRIGPIMVGDTPPNLTIVEANPQVALNRPFGDGPNLTLLGYDWNEQAGSSEFGMRLTLYWRSESPLNVDYTTFVHLRNLAGETIAQRDRLPLNGAYPTSLWRPGEIIADEIDLPLPGGLPEGGYQVVIGLYDFQTGQRLDVPGNGAAEVRLVDFEVTP